MTILPWSNSIVVVNIFSICFLFYFNRWFGIQLNPHFMGIDLKYVIYSSLLLFSYPHLCINELQNWMVFLPNIFWKIFCIYLVMIVIKTKSLFIYMLLSISIWDFYLVYVLLNTLSQPFFTYISAPNRLSSNPCSMPLEEV